MSKEYQTVYQMVCVGERKHFSNRGKFNHGKVFESKDQITDEVKEDFITACCDSEDANDLYDLKRQTVKIKIVELTLIKNR